MVRRVVNQLPLKKDLHKIIDDAFQYMWQTGYIEYHTSTPLRKKQSFRVSLMVIPERIP